HRPGHFMPASLVDSQFATLEPPYGEPLTLIVDASQPIDVIGKQAAAWWKDSHA
ncbi:putative Gluconokinase, partial [Pseudomonas savastanoi pv. glycinea]